MSDLLRLADECEKATIEQQRDLLERAYEAVHGKSAYCHRSYSEGHEVQKRAITFVLMLNATAFVDASMMLVPPRTAYAVGVGGDEPENIWAWVRSPLLNPVNAATPALALTAASLRAIHERNSHG